MHTITSVELDSSPQVQGSDYRKAKILYTGKQMQMFRAVLKHRSGPVGEGGEWGLFLGTNYYWMGRILRLRIGWGSQQKQLSRREG